MEKVRLWCGQPSDRGRLKNRTVVRQVCCRAPAPSSDRYLLHGGKLSSKSAGDRFCWRSMGQTDSQRDSRTLERYTNPAARCSACYAGSVSLLCPRRRRALSDTAIDVVCLSVSLSQPRLSARWLPAAGRPPEICGLRTRPRTDVDPPRVELPSAARGHIVSPPPGAITCLIRTRWSLGLGRVCRAERAPCRRSVGALSAMNASSPPAPTSRLSLSSRPADETP